MHGSIIDVIDNETYFFEFSKGFEANVRLSWIEKLKEQVYTYLKNPIIILQICNWYYIYLGQYAFLSLNVVSLKN